MTKSPAAITASASHVAMIALQSGPALTGSSPSRDAILADNVGEAGGRAFGVVRPRRQKHRDERITISHGLNHGLVRVDLVRHPERFGECPEKRSEQEGPRDRGHDEHAQRISCSNVFSLVEKHGFKLRIVE